MEDHGTHFLSQAEYSYNDLVNRSTGLTPFQIVYGNHPRGILQLRNIRDMERKSAQAKEFVQVMKDIQEQVKNNLHMSSTKYKE